ncbi:MAG TPA: BT_3928 family protein [Cytophagaceae bacterium]
MRIINEVCRYLTGALFIFSGLIKLNDPYGLAYKMEEYFEIFSQDFSPVFENFVPYALFLSVSLSALEVALGVAILIYYRMKITMWVALLLILYFTFLTFYAWYFDKLKECGCFGDFIKLSAKASFIKDIILVVFIGILFWNRKKLYSPVSLRTGDIISGVSFALAVFVGYFAIQHLPYFDFRPYKVGNNIVALMKAEEAPRYKYIMSKEGKTYEFTKYPKEPGYKLDTFLLLNPDKIYPKITDYRVYNEEGDFTDSTFIGTRLFIIIRKAEEAFQSEKKMKKLEEISQLIRQLESANVQPMVLTSSGTESIEILRHEVNLAAPYYFSDGTVLKTMIRSDPGLVLIKNGTIKGKWHYNDVPEAKDVIALVEK